MTKIRIYELSKELGLTNKELLERLHKEGYTTVKSVSSGLEETDAAVIRQLIADERKAKATPGSTVVLEEKSETPKEEAKSPLQEEKQPKEAVVPAPIQEDESSSPDTNQHAITLTQPVLVRDLAEKLSVRPNELIGELMMMSVFATINQQLETPIIEKLCAKHGVTFSFVTATPEKTISQTPTQDTTPTPHSNKKNKNKEKNKNKHNKDQNQVGDGDQPRPPVVVFMGHVDHGKTSLQDYIRKTRITAKEAGGITQHIGASVVHHNGQTLTFLDTPGHEAFTAMRARGANVTDIAVLVVAADDGVMPQTIEAINHARSAGVPIIVAMNKMDKPQANPDKVLIGLQRQNIQTEDWGGDVGVVRVSALTGEGTNNLLDRILLEAEMLELKANPSAPLEGQVLEAQLETGMGPTCSILVRNGSIHVGDIVLCGEFYGRVKALINEQGQRVKSAGPSAPIKVMGLNGVPNAGDTISTVKDEREAKQIAEEQIQQNRQSQLNVTRQTSLDDLFKQMQEESKKELRIIVKSDVKGSLEAIINQIAKLETEVSHKILLNVIHGSVGEISESDVLLAAASDAVILGFNVKAMPEIRRLAKTKGVEINLYSIIYELLENLENAILGKLDPETKESLLGKAEIIQIFESSKAGKICGCRVTEGIIRVGAKAQVFRDHEMIYNGLIKSLRRFKDDVKEVRQGFECGIRLDNFEEFEEGDIIKVFSVEKVAATI